MSHWEAQGLHEPSHSQIHPQEKWAPSPSVCVEGEKDGNMTPIYIIQYKRYTVKKKLEVGKEQVIL